MRSARSSPKRCRRRNRSSAEIAGPSRTVTGQHTRCPVAFQRTTIVAVMNGCTEQKYAYVPGFVNTTL